jgi:Raf kinase inhibitor-like YbhB/YbcL family protein
MEQKQAGYAGLNVHNRSRLIRLTEVAALGIVLSCSSAEAAVSVVEAGAGLPPGAKENIIMPLIIVSPSFTHSGAIPARHSCDGVNISPALKWTGVPPGTKSLALVVDDPDAPDPAAPKMTWVHWVLYNIPASAIGLTEGIAANDLPAGTMQGLNDWQRTGYGGPCPPIGKHRYFFKLYAMDTLLPDMKHPAKAALEKAMRGHVIGQTELIGLYQRGR